MDRTVHHYYGPNQWKAIFALACEYIRLSSLLATRDVSQERRLRKFLSGKELGETDVFAGYFPRVLIGLPYSEYSTLFTVLGRVKIESSFATSFHGRRNFSDK